jgi:hypothetical protein
MKEKNTNMDINLESREWMEKDEDGAARHFVNAGFSSTKQVMEMRVFDMLNICGIDRIMAEEMMYALYRFFNDNSEADEALYYGAIDQYFDYAGWRKNHPDVSKVLVEDIILADGMNFEALEALFDRVARRFWKSEEYNSRRYRYWGYSEMAHEIGWGNEE